MEKGRLSALARWHFPPELQASLYPTLEAPESLQISQAVGSGKFTLAFCSWRGMGHSLQVSQKILGMHRGQEPPYLPLPGGNQSTKGRAVCSFLASLGTHGHCRGLGILAHVPAHTSSPVVVKIVLNTPPSEHPVSLICLLVSLMGQEQLQSAGKLMPRAGGGSGWVSPPASPSSTGRILRQKPCGFQKSPGTNAGHP